MKLEIGKYQIEIKNESDYEAGSADNRFNYETAYLSQSDFVLPTKIGIKVLESGVVINSAIIGAEGGASGLHQTSQIIENEQILICCSDTVFCLELPSLNLKWKTKTDESTSFEIYKIESGYIVHGELEISRINEDGEIVWQNGGANIFVTPDGTDDFEIQNNIITAIDWEHRIYKWDFDGKEIK